MNDKPQTSSQSSSEKKNKKGAKNKNNCPSGVGKNDQQIDG